MISSKTKTVGLIGNPVEHSVSPNMHNAAFRELGLDYVYLTFRVEEDRLEGAVDGIRSLGFEGANVTIPHKSAVMEYLDDLDEIARKIGAVNTIKRENHSLKGFNTDGLGALRALNEEIGDIRGKKVVLLGAGGAARAIAFTLAEKGAKITISNRTASKAKNLKEEIEKKTGSDLSQIPQEEKFLREAIGNSEILINSTSVGMHPNEGETILESKSLHPDLTVMDIVYNPIRTKLLREAEEAGANTIDGLRMLVHQGVAGFEIWTGETPPIEVMKKATREALED